ncbi:MAG TPA: hypothetical protein VMI54_21285 [Polyangiaceae bacterium]|nr:hypothetical protein [Polyangiaceae bacterium]
MRPFLSPRVRLASAALFALVVLAPACKKEDEGPADATCGKKPLPDCPLQKWMKENMKPALDQNDTARLAQTFDQVAAHPPAGFTGWDTIAKKGADAARQGDIQTVKAECKACHDELRSRFRKEIRDKPLF